jgi:hypothetical protein
MIVNQLDEHVQRFRRGIDFHEELEKLKKYL